MTETIARTTVGSFDRLFIGGDWVEPATDAVIESISAVTGRVIATVPEASNLDVDAAVAAARKAFDHGEWPRLTGPQRAEYILRLRDEVEARLPAMTDAFVEEIGTPRALAEGFHGSALAALEDGARQASTFEFEEVRVAGDTTVTVLSEPIGVVAAIIPWNGPVTNACLKLAPALAAGCTIVIKPAPEGPVSVMMLGEAVKAAGIPAGVVSILPAGREVGEHLVTHPDIDKVAFTGSTAAGRKIMSLCGERIRNVTLELGGKSAAVILDDIPMDQVVPFLLPAGLIHSGQVCAALTRILVPRARQDELVEALREGIAAWPVGDPAAEGTALGPLVAERQRDRVEEYVKVGVEEGARLVIGEDRTAVPNDGWFVAPAVFADVDNAMRIAQEEIFGPVLSVIPFDTTEDAVRIANGTIYGLSGAVYASDVALAQSVARRLHTGQVSVNTWNICLTEPFGGYKQSGLGREGGREGILPYLETKLLQH